MNSSKRTLISGSIPRWLAVAGIAAGLAVPLSASANHEGNGVVEVLASAAVAYVVIDAVGGFDGKDRHDRRHPGAGHRDRRHDRNYGYLREDRHQRARHDRYAHSRHGSHRYEQRYKHGHYRNKHNRGHRYESDRKRHGRDHYRHRAYH